MQWEGGEGSAAALFASPLKSLFCSVEIHIQSDMREHALLYERRRRLRKRRGKANITAPLAASLAGV
jgi:hypothetical protein